MDVSSAKTVMKVAPETRASPQTHCERTHGNAAPLAQARCVHGVLKLRRQTQTRTSAWPALVAQHLPTLCGLVLLSLVISGCSDPASTPQLPATETSSAPKSTAPGNTPAQTEMSAGEAESTVVPGDNKEQETQTATDETASGIPGEQARVVTETSNRLRLADDRPSVNERRLEINGIRSLESRRLRLLTDLPLEQVSALPELADQLFAALEGHFGKLPPAIDGSEFQVTGHLIGDEKKFHAAGLMPSTAFTFEHGRHLNYQFWMYNPPQTYYRRHLLLHEFTHCFMTCESGMQDIPPLWYIEGMAEYFATHRLPSDSRNSQVTKFGVLPDAETGFEGWGRVAELRRSIPQKFGESSEQLTIPALREVMPSSVTSFGRNMQYAQSWALCWLIQSHAKHRTSFRPLAKLRTRTEFLGQLQRIRDEIDERLSADWMLTVESLRLGFDTERSFPVHAEKTWTTRGAPTRPKSFELLAAHDWQDTGLRLAEGHAVEVACTGRYQVNDSPEPWISEPQGISIEYYRGRPLGQVSGILVGAAGESVSARFSIGRKKVVRADRSCSLWLQINDSPASRRNNAGAAQITIRVVE